MPKKYKKVGKFTRHQLDKHRALLASAPDTIEKRQNSIHHRNQLLAATQAYNLGLEKNANAIAPDKPPARTAASRHRGVHGNAHSSNQQLG